MYTVGDTPYSLTAASYSCWPVFVIPVQSSTGCWLWGLTTSFFLMLSLVQNILEKNFGVLMQPLVDELQKLMEGVETWEASLKWKFNMRAAYLWSIHDFPALGKFLGWSAHGMLACHHCLGDTNAFWLSKGGKASWFDCHRRFLPIDHEFRTQRNAFRKDTIVLDEPPGKLIGEEVEAQMNL